MLHRHIHRTYISGAVYFVTTNVWLHATFFEDGGIAKIVEWSIWWQRCSKYVVYAYVVMPDHLHILVQPTVGNISNIMKSIKENSSRDINTYLNSGDGAVAAMANGGGFQWQKGFYDHIIRDDRDFLNHIEYIRYNPVKAGLVERPDDYQFLFMNEDAVQHILE